MAIPRRVLIVGGGIAGLTLAVALERRGASPELVDIAPQWGPVGSGIAIGFNGILALNSVGLGQAVQERGVPLEEISLLNADGELISRFGFGAVGDTYGVRTTGIHRAALHDVLATALASTPRLGTTVSALHQRTDSIVAEFGDGSDGEYDLVVGADGRDSRVRALTFGDVRSRYAGYAAIRVIVPRPQGFRGLVELWGPGRRMGILPIDENRLYSYSTFMCAPGAKRSAEESLQVLCELFAKFDGPARHILNSSPEDDSVHSGDIAQIVIPRWSNGRAVLIGDAAHAMCPDLGQGGSMAIEDAMALVSVLDRGSEIASALSEFERLRRARVRAVQRRSRQYGWTVHRKHAIPRRALRGLVRRSEPESIARMTAGAVLNPL